MLRNGYAKEREVLLGAGAVEVRAPRVNDCRVDEEDGERRRFKSVIVPPYMRRCAKVSEVLPLLYLPMDSLAGTSSQPSRSSLAPRLVFRRRASPGSPSGSNPRGRAS